MERACKICAKAGSCITLKMKKKIYQWKCSCIYFNVLSFFPITRCTLMSKTLRNQDNCHFDSWQKGICQNWQLSKLWKVTAVKTFIVTAVKKRSLSWIFVLLLLTDFSVKSLAILYLSSFCDFSEMPFSGLRRQVSNSTVTNDNNKNPLTFVL